MRLQGSGGPNGKTLFVALRGVWALWCFGISAFLALASPAGSTFHQIVIIFCVFSFAAVVWAGATTLSAIVARQYGRPGTGRIDAIEPVFALYHPMKWRESVLDRSKARLVFTDNFGVQHASLAHSRAYFGTLEIGQHVGVHVGKRRTWWNGDIGHRRTRTAGSTQPAGQTE